MKPKSAILNFIIFLFISFFLGCSKNKSSDSNFCGNTQPSTSLITGPLPGTSLNQSDNPFRALAIHPSNPNIIYIGSEGNGLFKSTDGGTNWTWLRNGLYHCDAYPEIYSISIDSNNPNQILIATNAGPGSISKGPSVIAGAYKSINAGEDWTQINQGLPNSNINSALIVSGSHFLIGLGAGASTNFGDEDFYSGGIYTLGFSGTNWIESSTPISSNSSIYWQIINKDSGLLAFGGTPTSGGSGTSSGILKSTDGGQSWIPLLSALPDLAAAHIEASSDLQTIYANTRNGSGTPYFYKSIDGGTNWTNPVLVENLVSGPIKIIGNDSNTVLAGQFNSIIRTIDGFTNITTVLTTPSTENYIAAIETAPSNSNIVYASSTGLLLFKSTNGGLSFTQVANLRDFINNQ